MANEKAHHRCIVLKLGGSVLHRSPDYDRCAAHLGARLRDDPGARLVVVVSARFGHTDRLLRSAVRAGGDERDAATTLWLATGELQSVAMLTLRLRRRAVQAVGIGPQQTGINVAGADASDPSLRVDALGIQQLLDRHHVVVVPGFIGTAADAQWVTLGRGGSDLTAVALAAALGAWRCELVKDVPGYFTDDPNACTAASHLPRISYDEALAMASVGCDLVQPDALRLARRHRVRMIVRDLNERGRSTVVDIDGAGGSRNSNHTEALAAV